jgi:hypothetical protein
MFQTPSKETIGTPNTFDQSLHSVFTFSDVLEANVITLLKPGKDPKFPPNLLPISLLSTMGKLFEEVILKIVQRHIEKEACLMQASSVSVHITA